MGRCCSAVTVEDKISSPLRNEMGHKMEIKEAAEYQGPVYPFTAFTHVLKIIALSCLTDANEVMFAFLIH